MSEITRRQFLREKEAARLLDELSQRLKIDVRELLDAKKPSVEVAQSLSGEVVYLEGKPFAARLKDMLIPTLLFEKALQRLPRIVVNMGAVPHICNGADVLAPGMVGIDGSFTADSLVVVVDERHKKPLAVAVALVDSQTAQSLSHGKVARNLHFVGDALWNQLRKA